MRNRHGLAFLALNWVTAVAILLAVAAIIALTGRHDLALLAPLSFLPMLGVSTGTYEVHGDAQTVATAITILEVTAPATGMYKLLRAYVNQSSVTTSTTTRIRLLRKSGTITGTASPPSAVPTQVGQAAFDGTVKWIATVEGTDGVFIKEEAFNYLSGWELVFGDAEAPWVPPSGIIALKFPAAPTSASWTFGLVLQQYS